MNQDSLTTPAGTASFRQDDSKHSRNSIQQPSDTSSLMASHRRTLASELAGNQQSTSLITTTRPPSSFNHQSLYDSKGRSTYGNDHNIWGHHESASSIPPRPFYSGDHRPLSPGQYFGARSLPLASMGELWQASSPKKKDESIESRTSSEPLWQHFKALPTSLHHRHDWHHPPKAPSYTLHPQTNVSIQCVISSTTIHSHDGHLTLTNRGAALVFSLFSANGQVTFDRQSGSVEPGETVDIWIRPRKRILHRLVRQDTVLDESVVVLIGKDMIRLKVDLDITVEDDEEDDEDDSQGKTSPMDDKRCPFCVLETIYPS